MKVTTFDFDASAPRPDWREGQFDHLTPIDIKGQSADVCWQANAVFLGPTKEEAMPAASLPPLPGPRAYGAAWRV